MVVHARNQSRSPNQPVNRTRLRRSGLYRTLVSGAPVTSTLGRILPIMHEAIQRPSELQAKGDAFVSSAAIRGILKTSPRVKVARRYQSFVAGSRRSLTRTNVHGRNCQATPTGRDKQLSIVPAGEAVDWSTHCKTIVAFTERGRASQTQHPNRSFERTHTGGARVWVIAIRGAPVCAAQFRR